MPDNTVLPAAKPFDPDDLDTPVAVAAMDAIDTYTGERSGAGLYNVALAKARIGALRAYLSILNEELDRAAANTLCNCPNCVEARMGVPS